MKKISEDVQVTKEDQANINTFSKLYHRSQEIDDALLKLKEKVNQHQDTLDEIELADDEEILRYRFGACFFHLPSTPPLTQPPRSEISSKRISPRSRKNNERRRRNTKKSRRNSKS